MVLVPMRRRLRGPGGSGDENAVFPVFSTPEPFSFANYLRISHAKEKSSGSLLGSRDFFPVMFQTHAQYHSVVLLTKTGGRNNQAGTRNNLIQLRKTQFCNRNLKRSSVAIPVACS